MPACFTSQVYYKYGSKLFFCVGCILWALCTLVQEESLTDAVEQDVYESGEGRVGDLRTQVVPCHLLFTQCNSLCRA